ncbi:hypothetical protein AAFF_G00264660 [Aldrovandia affinis]|uniref:Laminin G domain-containing protein n=1 Tax=Aldrovandia affinis TaxID=143900 RepID=A0AAD7RC79_9TELE|nr:hypothetical protein AAFF_G00264660 [Aldrovandia affinis]
MPSPIGADDQGRSGSLELRFRLGPVTHEAQVSPRNLADGFPHRVSIHSHNGTVRTQLDYSDPVWERIPLLQDVGFDPKSMFLGRVTEVGDAVDDDIQRHNEAGLEGCLSGVRYNIHTPLKTHFRPPGTAGPVAVQGYVTESNCGAFPPVLGLPPPEPDPWDPGPEFEYRHDDLPSTAAMTLASLFLLLVLTFGVLCVIYLFLYRYKGSYHTNEPKNMESPSRARRETKPLHKERNLPEDRRRPGATSTLLPAMWRCCTAGATD